MKTDKQQLSNKFEEGRIINSMASPLLQRMVAMHAFKRDSRRKKLLKPMTFSSCTPQFCESQN